MIVSLNQVFTKILLILACLLGLFFSGDASSKKEFIDLSVDNEYHPYFIPNQRDAFITIGIVFDLLSRYYVDKENLNNSIIIKNTIEQLNILIPQWKLRTNEDYYIVSPNKNKNLKFKSNPDNFELLQYFIKLTELVKHYTEIKDPLHFVLNALFYSLDHHTVYLSKDEYNFLIEETQGDFGGVGIVIGFKNYNLTVIKPIHGSPAHKAGIRKDDIIVAINDVPTWGIKLTDLVKTMRGKAGASVKLSILRKGELKTKEIILKRAMIPINPVEAKHVFLNNKNILQLKIENFSSRTTSGINQTMKDFKKKHKIIDAMVLDLRSNPGGLLDQAISVTDLFLNEGIIVSTKGHIEEIEHAERNQNSWDFPMVVLIDLQSASASEIVAGALRDHKRAIILGQASYGKGSVQTVFPLRVQNSALKLTIARYYTPLGTSIDGKGVSPDLHMLAIYPNEDNINLFGFLRYHKAIQHEYLLAKSHKDIINLTERKSMYQGYYLSEDNRDTELEVALDIASKLSFNWKKVKKKYKNLEQFYMKVIDSEKSLLSKEEHKAKRFLKTKDVIWKKSDNLEKNKVKIKKISWENKGNKIKFNVEIKNTANTDVNGLSLYIQGLGSHGFFNEVLIGKIKKHSTILHSLTVETPYTNIVTDEMVLLTAGIAFGGIASAKHTKKVLVSFVGRELPVLSSFAILLDHNKNSILEKDESANIKIFIENRGSKKLDDLSVALTNLSGEQLAVSSITKKISAIFPNTRSSVTIDIIAGKKILSEKLTLGILVKAPFLPNPHFNTIQIQSMPHSKHVLKKSH